MFLRLDGYKIVFNQLISLTQDTTESMMLGINVIRDVHIILCSLHQVQYVPFQLIWWH